MITINHNTRRHISPAVAAAIATSLLWGGMADATSFGDAPNYKTGDPQLRIGSVIVRQADTRGWSDQNDHTSNQNMAENGSTTSMGDISINVNDLNYRGTAPLRHDRSSHGLEYLKSEPTTLYTQDHQHSARVSVEVSRAEAHERSLMHPMTKNAEASDNFKVRGGTVILQQDTATTGSLSEQTQRNSSDSMIGDRAHL